MKVSLTSHLVSNVATAGLLAALVGGPAACSSSNFSTSNADGGDDGGGNGGDASPTTSVTSDDGGGSDAAEVAVDPCASDPALGKICLHVQTSGTHPPYNSDAATLGLDGKGKLGVVIYTSDPTIPGPTTSGRTLVYPDATTSAELNIDADFPYKAAIVLTGAEVKAGHVWIAAAFLDNNTTPRGPKGTDSVVGDFVVPTTDSRGRPVVDSLAVAKGNSVDHTLIIQPLRRVPVRLSMDPTVAHDPNANANGEVLFDIFDAPSTAVGISESKCVTFGDLTAVVPATPDTTFLTAATGAHKLLALFLDYVPGPSSTSFPPDGSMVNANSLIPAPDFAVDPAKWVQDATRVKFIQQVDPGSAARNTCVP